MQILPPQLVPAATGFLKAQGLPPIFAADGSLDGGATVALLFDEVRVSTAITPDLVFPIGPTGGAPSRAQEELLAQLQPTVTLSGRAGTVTVSPYGHPHGEHSWLPLALLGGGAVLFLGWAIFGGR